MALPCDGLGRAGETDVVADDGVRTDRQLFGARPSDVHEFELVPPGLAKEVLERHRGELLTGTAPVAEAEGREARVVAYWQRTIVDDPEHRAEGAVVHG